MASKGPREGPCPVPVPAPEKGRHGSCGFGASPVRTRGRGRGAGGAGRAVQAPGPWAAGPHRGSESLGFLSQKTRAPEACRVRTELFLVTHYFYGLTDALPLGVFSFSL